MLLQPSAEACVGLSASRALVARLQRMSGAGLWFEPQGSELLPCGAAVRSHVSSSTKRIAPASQPCFCIHGRHSPQTWMEHTRNPIKQKNRSAGALRGK
ncbi:hypothetical protein C6I21_05905 [Alkalicoccus urumqiensis]|uniref:Uncharacterized protein n=1 Tax=Alkalicoccus urumqiensis TaxID=1548213 RepID=A0A2P6MJ82_ALKUR|nr:hypothetical protein C6I21_05905 [Alkalicoccus urumqiensis]